jgi:hypothetical protein
MEGARLPDNIRIVVASKRHGYGCANGNDFTSVAIRCWASNSVAGDTARYFDLRLAWNEWPCGGHSFE